MHLIQGLNRLAGSLLYALGPERLIPKVTPRVACSFVPTGRQIALTFDDGPNPEYTPRVLDLLARYTVPATFFLIGRNLLRHPQVGGRIVAQGHGIGNHTYTHPALLFLDEDTLRNEIARAHRLMADLLHVQSTLFRPPWGLVSARVLDVVAGLGYRAVVGDVFPYDTNGPGADQIVRRVLRRVAPGSILILHDGYTTSRDVDKSQTVRALEQILPALLDQGYEFVPLARPLGPEQFRSA